MNIEVNYSQYGDPTKIESASIPIETDKHVDISNSVKTIMLDGVSTEVKTVSIKNVDDALVTTVELNLTKEEMRDYIRLLQNFMKQI